MNVRKMLTTIMLALALVVFAQGCNTMRGMGQDIENAGDAIEDAAD